MNEKSNTFYFWFLKVIFQQEYFRNWYLENVLGSCHFDAKPCLSVLTILKFVISTHFKNAETKYGKLIFKLFKKLQWILGYLVKKYIKEAPSDYFVIVSNWLAEEKMEILYINWKTLHNLYSKLKYGGKLSFLTFVFLRNDHLSLDLLCFPALSFYFIKCYHYLFYLSSTTDIVTFVPHSHHTKKKTDFQHT